MDAFAPQYDLDYFISKFESIPDERWTVSELICDGRLDAYGHCGEIGDDVTIEAQALWNLVRHYGILTDVNDGLGEYAQLGDTPRSRVLAFLRDIDRNH